MNVMQCGRFSLSQSAQSRGQYNIQAPRLKPLLKGIGSFLIPQLRTTHSPPLGVVSAEYCYSIFMRHISLLNAAGVTEFPKVVAELGPGSSMGAGFAALIAGAEKYYALDIVNHSNLETNLHVFDELAALFRNRAPIPDSGIHQAIFPDLNRYGFPEFLTFRPDAAFERRVSIIRKDIQRQNGVFFEVAAPWTRTSNVKPHTVDWVFSHSVLEHVDDLSGTYSAIAEWLKPSACTSHLIDFYSHEISREWNGHWAIGDFLWLAIRGRRPYLLNRSWCSMHRKLAAENGFIILLEKVRTRLDGLRREQFAPRFRMMSDDDARTRMMFLIGQFSD
jgi:hypothetical protein